MKAHFAVAMPPSAMSPHAACGEDTALASPVSPQRSDDQEHKHKADDLSSSPCETPPPMRALVTPPDHLSTYAPGEEGRRLATVAGEFGGARCVKPQVRKSTFAVSRSNEGGQRHGAAFQCFGFIASSRCLLLRSRKGVPAACT